MGLVPHIICLFAPQRLLHSLHLPTEGWPGWVDLDGWLHAEMVYPCAKCKPAKYYLGPAWINFVHWDQRVNHSLH